MNGGLDLAVQQVYDAAPAWHVEFDAAPSKILAHHWPDVPNIGDITAVDWATVERPDILTGGFPCQDVSVAGRRAGMTDGTRSGLWSHMVKAIDTLRPGLVVIENVGGLFSAQADSRVEPCDLHMGDADGGGHTVLLRALDSVLATLSELGYDAQWTALRASDVGAPHGRLRVFIVAHPAGYPWRLGHGNGGAAEDASGGRGGGRPPVAVAGGEGGQDTATVGADPRPDAPGGAPALTLLPTPAAARAGRQRSVSAGSAVRPTLDSIHRLLPTPRTTDMHGAGVHGDGGLDLRTAVTLLPTPRASDGPDASSHSRSWSSTDRNLHTVVRTDELTPDFGPYAPAIARWEAVLGRPAPSPTEPGKTRPRLSARFVEWLMGLPDGHVTGVPGITRNQELKALGNGVVPLQAATALRHLLWIGETS